MKKSKFVSLVLITASLASCNKPHKKIQDNDWSDGRKKVYMRSDSTATYDNCYNGYGNYWMWYYAFRPYGMYYGWVYHHYGYYSAAISDRANIGGSSAKAGIIRGGFGGSHSYSVSS